MSTRPHGDLPLRLLFKIVNNTILVKLKDGSEYIGQLVRCDPCMNLYLVDTKEVDEEKHEPVANLGKVLIRGSNILFIVTDINKMFLESGK